MNKLHMTLIGWALLTATVSAENLVKFPGGPASWTIAVTASGSAGKKGADSSFMAIVEVEVVQDGQTYRQVIRFSDGSKREIWGIRGMDQALTDDRNGSVFFTSDPIPFSPSDFAWIQAGLLQEKEAVNYRGKKCFHYRGEVAVEPGAGRVTYDAWIDSESRLPVALDTGADLAVFTFKQPPSGNLAVPDKFKMPLENKKRMMGIR